MPAGSDRIALLSHDGTIATIRPDGSARRVVSAARPSRLHQQLAWAPDGRRIAFGRLEREAGRPARASVVTADPDGGDQLATPLATVPFYLAWRPDGGAIACLGNGPSGIDLTLVEPGLGGRVLLRGSPLFLAWSADATQLACHVDDERLLVIDDGGRGVPRQIAVVEGFTCPVWLADGIGVDIDEGDRRRIAVLDPATGAVRRRLARHDGWARLVARPGDGRLAYSVGALAPGRPPTVLNEADEAVPEALCVADIGSGGLDVVTASTPIAAEWSPDGKRLLVLVQDTAASLQWIVWDGGLEATRLASFVPSSLVARTELPFADQYAQSRRSWSPDGSRVCWTARGRDKVDRLWVAEVGSGADGAAPPPQSIAEASACAWAPATVAPGADVQPAR